MDCQTRVTELWSQILIGNLPNTAEFEESMSDNPYYFLKPVKESSPFPINPCVQLQEGLIYHFYLLYVTTQTIIFMWLKMSN